MTNNFDNDELNSEERKLIELGEDFIEAVKSGDRAKIAKFLKNKKLDVDVVDEDGKSALIIAVENNDVEVAKLLLEHGANVNFQEDNEVGNTPLICAAKQSYGDIEMMKLLLEHGADVNLQNKRGKTPLMYAGAFFEPASLLLEHGADMNIKDNKGNTVLPYVARLGYAESLDLLLSDTSKFEVSDAKKAILAARGNKEVQNCIFDAIRKKLGKEPKEGFIPPRGAEM